MLLSRVGRRALTTCLNSSVNQNKKLNKNLTFKVGKLSIIQTPKAQRLFTKAFDKNPRDTQGKAAEEKVKAEVFRKFESEGLRSVFNDEILTAVSNSSSIEDLNKSGALIGLYKTFLFYFDHKMCGVKLGAYSDELNLSKFK